MSNLSKRYILLLSAESNAGNCRNSSPNILTKFMLLNILSYTFFHFQSVWEKGLFIEGSVKQVEIWLFLLIFLLPISPFCLKCLASISALFHLFHVSLQLSSPSSLSSPSPPPPAATRAVCTSPLIPSLSPTTCSSSPSIYTNSSLHHKLFSLQVFKFLHLQLKYLTSSQLTFNFNQSNSSVANLTFAH